MFRRIAGYQTQHAKEHSFERSFVAEKEGFSASPSACLRSALRALSAALPGAGKPSTGRFSGSALRIPLNHSTNKSTRADALVCGGEGGIRTLAPVTPVYSLSRGAPYSHLGTSPYSISPFLAEREGFEPPVPFSITGFQDQLHKPLGHLSKICT